MCRCAFHCCGKAAAFFQCCIALKKGNIDCRHQTFLTTNLVKVLVQVYQNKLRKFHI